MDTPNMLGVSLSEINTLTLLYLLYYPGNVMILGFIELQYLKVIYIMNTSETCIMNCYQKISNKEGYEAFQ